MFYYLKKGQVLFSFHFSFFLLFCFLSIIWPPQCQFWTINRELASLTRCQSQPITWFGLKIAGNLVTRLGSNARPIASMETFDSEFARCRTVPLYTNFYCWHLACLSACQQFLILYVFFKNLLWSIFCRSKRFFRSC